MARLIFNWHLNVPPFSSWVRVEDDIPDPLGDFLQRLRREDYPMFLWCMQQASPSFMASQVRGEDCRFSEISIIPVLPIQRKKEAPL